MVHCVLQMPYFCNIRLSQHNYFVCRQQIPTYGNKKRGPGFLSPYRYGLDDPGFECRWGAPVQTSPGAHPASYTINTGSFPRVKRPGRGVDHPPPPSAAVNPLNAELNPLCYLLALLGAHHILLVSRIRVIGTVQLYLYPPSL
jgi:hypothetical protein